LVEIRVHDENGFRGLGPVGTLFGTLGREARCDHPNRLDTYLENLQRLALVRVPESELLADDEVYMALRANEVVKGWLDSAQTAGWKPFTVARAVTITSLGKEFCDACGLR
jgi:hypothetical protein